MLYKNNNTNNMAIQRNCQFTLKGKGTLFCGWRQMRKTHVKHISPTTVAMVTAQACLSAMKVSANIKMNEKLARNKPEK